MAGKALGAGDLTPIIARMLADGTLDPDFDDNGLLRIPIVIGEDQAEAMALSSGRPVIAGRALISSSSGAAILRLNSDLIFANDLGGNY